MSASSVSTTLPFARISNPRLTTVSQRSDDLGRISVDFLLSTLEHGRLPVSQLMPVSLVVRETTPGPAPRANARKAVDRESSTTPDGHSSRGTPIDRATRRATSSSSAAAAAFRRSTASVTRVGRERVEVWRREGIEIGEHPYPDGCVRHRLRLACGVHDRCRSGVDIGFLRGQACRPMARPARKSHAEAFFVVRPSSPIVCRRDPRAGHQHLQRLQPVGRKVLLQRRREGLVRPAVGARLPPPTRRARRGRVRRPDGRPPRGARRGASCNCSSTSPTSSIRCGAASGSWHNWERRFVRWAENEGLTLDYAVNSDLEFHPEVLDGQRLMLSVGHDEYWSWGMRDRADAFVEDGRLVGGLLGQHLLLAGALRGRRPHDGRLQGLAPNPRIPLPAPTITVV